MGYYIDPEDMPKEQWLRLNATEVTLRDVMEWDLVSDGHLPIVLINNGPFTAAGIAYNKRELAAFTDPKDPRPKLYFVATRAKILEVCPQIKGYI